MADILVLLAIFTPFILLVVAAAVVGHELGEARARRKAAEDDLDDFYRNL